MASVITATGVGLPELVVSNDDIADFLEGVDDEWMRKRTGIRERHIAVSENTSDLAIRAVKQVIERSGIDPCDIDLIVAASCTPDYQTPNLGSMVQKGIGADNAVCFGLSAACSGFVFALSVADKYINSGLAKKAIVVGAEVLSKAANWSDKNTCVLFGDGAAAVLLEYSDKGGILKEELGSKGNKYHVLTHGAFPAANAFNDTEPMKHEDAFIAMDGLEVFSFATKKLSESIGNILEASDMSFEDIKYIVPHQANYRIIEAVSKKLKIPVDKFYLNLDRFGNTSSASIPICLDELFSQGKLESGDRIIIAGFGGGLTWGTMLIEV